MTWPWHHRDYTLTLAHTTRTAINAWDCSTWRTGVLVITSYFKCSPFLFSCVPCLQRLIVCLEESLYIHNIRDMKVMHTIRDTPPNPSGLVALSINNENCFLAYPGSSQIGEVQIFDCVGLVNFVSLTGIWQRSPMCNRPVCAFVFCWCRLCCGYRKRRRLSQLTTTRWQLWRSTQLVLNSLLLQKR